LLTRFGACVGALCLSLLQVRAVPIRKDDEVMVVRGTYKVCVRCECAAWGNQQQPQLQLQCA
jgi:hypothetical protein